MRLLVLALSFTGCISLSLNIHTAPLKPNLLQATRATAPMCNEPKGFGSAKPAAASSKKKKKKAPAAVAPRAAPSSAGPTSDAAPLYDAEARGKKMLEQMRQDAGSEPILKRDNVPMVLTEEELTPIDPTEGVMPEAVADRMLARIIPFALGPIVLGIFVFIGFFIANTQLNLDLPPQIVAYATQACLLLSFAGITFGVMSTELEEDAEQTMLGLDNVQKNVDNMRGVEDTRIMETKLDLEELDAAASGIMLNRNMKEKRDRQ